METAKEVLQLTNQIDIMKWFMVFLVLLSLALVLYVRYLTKVQSGVNERLKAQEAREAEALRMNQETEQYVRETKATIDKTIVDQTARREQAQLGVLAQFSEQQQSLLTVHQQTVMVLENVSKRGAQMESFIERLSSGIDERNELQARSVAEMHVGFNAIGEQLSAVAEGTASQIRPIQAGLEHANTVLGEHSTTLADIAESNASKLDDLRSKFDTLPDALAHTLAPIVDEWRSTNTKLNEIASHLQVTEKRLIDAVKAVVPPRETVEAVPVNERTAGQLAAASLRAEMGQA